MDLHQFRRSYEIARNEIAALHNEVRGRLVVGTSDTNCTILPSVLEEFRRCHPGVDLDIRNRISSEIANLVAADGINIGLGTLPVRYRDVQEKYPIAASGCAYL